MPTWLKHIDHTGDVGIIVTAKSREQLFARAAAGMFNVIAELDSIRPKQEFSLVLQASDLEALLVRWLSELNFRHITREELYCDFKILELTDTTLRAKIFGEPIDPERHIVYTEIKAVTYHGLSVRKRDEIWEARIIFDL